MNAKLKSGIATLGLIAVMGASPALADSLNAQWFQVSPSTADFASQCCSTVTNLVNAALGPNGMPVYNPLNGGPYSLTDISATTGELQWWTPGNGVTATGASVLSFTGSLNTNMYAPNGTGSNDGTSFQTAILTGKATIGTGGGSITFGGDDDTYLVLNGVVVDQIGGVHAQTDTSYNVGAGTYSVEVFYADRQQTGANFQFSVSNGSVSAVPETSTWAMMLMGFLGLAFAGARAKRSTAVNA